jgi:hypothetical protein
MGEVAASEIRRGRERDVELMKVGFILLCCLALSSCDADRLAKLEKENADLKAKIDRTDAAVDYDLKAKCAKDSKIRFNENWNSRDKNTIVLDFTNHYNAKQNKCFILVEYHYNSSYPGQDGWSWMGDANLYDVYENQKYAEFMESHENINKPKYSSEDRVISCDVQGDKCKTSDEFNKLVSPYMND